ncbi:FG-GAP repeat domain-containing protein [Phycicoccus duodecadis]|uniref:FG-GAP repeat domain-containing protein n=1 Tax=Phycicoccus duodecadis TaxID=173053 RepID=UPI00117E3DCD|nr:FG-GAP-like repeat-containing protein [Phycicoccus duodecadis]
MAAVLVAVSAAVWAGPARGEVASDTRPAPAVPLQRPGPVFPKPTSPESPKAQRSTGSTVQREGTVARVTPPAIDATCPAGQFVTTTYAVEGFESGDVPNPEYSEGWTVGAPEDGDAPEGSNVAMTTAAPEGRTDNVVNPLYSPVDPGGLFVSLTYRGTFEPGEAGLFINDGSEALAPSAEWRTIVRDATSVNAYDLVDVYVDLVTDVPGSTSHVEIDDVHAYRCEPDPVSGVRGDWTGDGLVDLLGTTTGGDLWMYPGRGNGRVSSGSRAGSGWDEYSWVGSPGDVSGDRRTDLVARDEAGALWLFAGQGRATFAPRRQVGSGWQSMTALATPADMDLDGQAELLARRSDGTLHLYSFTPTGGLRYDRQVGTGWNGMAWIIGMGDLDGDRRGDTVGVSARDGCLYAYRTTTAVTLGRSTKVGCGWQGMTWLTSPGDLDRDGLGDLYARRSDGSLWFYRGRVGGGVRSGVQVGSGWNGMETIT